MMWSVEYLREAVEDLKRLNNSQRLQVLKAIGKVSANPLPQSEGGYGKPLGKPLTVREITDRFGEPRGLARTTILTMLENLRKKGYVDRTDINGINHYASKTSKSDLLQNMVSDFIEKNLEGSLSPFMAYLTEKAEFNDEERAEIKRLLEKLEQSQSKE